MPIRHGIIYGMRSLVLRIWAHRHGRLVLIGLPLVLLPDVAVRTMYRILLALPQPERQQVWRAVWLHSYFYEWPALAMMFCGGLLLAVGCLRFLSERSSRHRTGEIEIVHQAAPD